MRLIPNPRSIAFRLILAVLAVEAISAVLVIVLSFGYERHTHFTAFGVMLHGRADSILGAVQDSEDSQDDLILNQSDLHLPRDLVWQVTDSDGRILGRSPNWTGPPAASQEEWHHGFLPMSLNRRHYALIVVTGSREVDPTTRDAKIHHLTIYCGSPVSPVWNAVWGAVEFYGAGSLLLLLVTGPLIAWLLQRGLTPVRQLATLASQVSVNSWRFDPPPNARSTPELAPLTLAIESVLERLERSFNQQRGFVSDAAHELKTAVAVVKSSLQVLSLRPRSIAEYTAGLARCLSDIERLEALVSQMLAMARVEAADRSGSAGVATQLVPCVEQAIENLAPFAQLRGVEVRASLRAAADVAGPLDAEDCRTLVSNLLLNALQHSPADSRVEVLLTQQREGLQLSVADQGEGLDPAALPHIFDRFYRGDPSRSRATGGSGLGLAICKALIDRAGGTIALENNPDGHGATATVWLPAAAAPLPSGQFATSDHPA
jgi:signal transduction histidine kinase